MKIPLRISTRKLTLSENATNNIKHKVDKLEQFYDKIIACKVMVETPHRHKNHGSLFHVSIDISIPGAELAVKHEAHEDLYVAIRNAFDAARRQLLNHNRKRKDKSNRSLANNIFDTELENIELEDSAKVHEAVYDLDYA